jgi:hypothetical protein
MVARSERRTEPIAILSSSSTKIVRSVLARKGRLICAPIVTTREYSIGRSNKSGVTFAGEAGRITRTIARSGDRVPAEERRGDRSRRGHADQSVRPWALARRRRRKFSEGIGKRQADGRRGADRTRGDARALRPDRKVDAGRSGRSGSCHKRWPIARSSGPAGVETFHRSDEMDSGVGRPVSKMVVDAS